MNVVDALKDLFEPDRFIMDMVDRGELEEYEVHVEYGQAVTSMCNNAAAWMVKELINTLDFLADELKDIFVCHGSYILCGARLPHTWLEHRGDETTVFDLTIAQFRERKDQIYIGRRLGNLESSYEVAVSDTKELNNFLSTI